MKKISAGILSAVSLATVLLAGCATTPDTLVVADTSASEIVTGSKIPRSESTDIKSISKAELQYFQSSGTSW